MTVRPALDTLRDLRDGKFLDELGVELNALVRAVRLTDKKGKVTITLEVAPVNQNSDNVMVQDKIKVETPQLKKSTLFFTTPESNLSRRDPRQPDLPHLEEVNGGEHHDDNQERA